MKNINFEFANKFGYEGMFTNNDSEKEYNEGFINVDLLMNYVKTNLDRHNNACFNQEDFLLKLSDLKPSHFRLDKVIPQAAHFLGLTPYPHYTIDIPVMDTQGQITIKRLTSRIILNERIDNIDFRAPVVNTRFDSTNFKGAYSVAFTYTTPGLDNELAIQFILDNFEEYSLLLNYFEDSYIVNYENYLRLKRQVAEAFVNASNDPEKLYLLYLNAPSFILYKRDPKKLVADLKIIIDNVDSYYVIQTDGGENDFSPIRKQWTAATKAAIIRLIKSFLPLDKDSRTGVIDNLEKDVVVKGEPIKGKKYVKPKLGFEYLLDALLAIDDRTTLFETIYEGFRSYVQDDSYFTEFIVTVYKYWIISYYVTDTKKLPYNNQREIWNYSNSKILGFYVSAYKFEFRGNQIEMLSNVHVPATPFKPLKYGSYHLFQPLRLIDSDLKGNLKVPTQLVPPFYLKAFESENSRNNLYSSLVLSFKISMEALATISIAGNIYKLRYLWYISRLGKAILITESIMLASTVLQLMLNFVEQCHSEDEESFCTKLQTYLFWVDIATLGVDFVLTRMLQKAAREATIAAQKEISAGANIDQEVITHLDEVAQGETAFLRKEEQDLAARRKADAPKQKGEQQKAEIKKKAEESSLSKKVYAKRRFREFVEKSKGYSIKNLSKWDIVENLRGYTQQANKIAKAIEEGEIVIVIKKEREFIKRYEELGGDMSNIARLTAFSYKEKMYFKNTTPIEQYFSELVHEGTHSLDYLNRFVGNNHSWEKRAYFFERQFQLAIGKTPDHSSIAKMIYHIKKFYKKF
jgi:hypothetical protein